MANSIAALSGASYSSGADKRRLQREQEELRQRERELKLEEGDIQYLAFESFHDLRDAKSGVVSEDVYSVVDSGTTVTIKRDDGTLMHQFDPRATIRIVGFNGSLSKSKGKGILVGYATAKSGKRVEIRVPESHAVANAPNDLLSVSAMLAQNLNFTSRVAVLGLIRPKASASSLKKRLACFG